MKQFIFIAGILYITILCACNNEAEKTESADSSKKDDYITVAPISNEDEILQADFENLSPEILKNYLVDTLFFLKGEFLPSTSSRKGLKNLDTTFVLFPAKTKLVKSYKTYCVPDGKWGVVVTALDGSVYTDSGYQDKLSKFELILSILSHEYVRIDTTGSFALHTYKQSPHQLRAF